MFNGGVANEQLIGIEDDEGYGLMEKEAASNTITGVIVSSSMIVWNVLVWRDLESLG